MNSENSENKGNITEVVTSNRFYRYIIPINFYVKIYYQYFIITITASDQLGSSRHDCAPDEVSSVVKNKIIACLLHEEREITGLVNLLKDPHSK